MSPKIKLYEQGLEKYPKGEIVFNNVLFILLIALGTIACRFIHPVLGWIYLSFAIVMVGIVLRRLVCTNCYYYDKWCSIGWGKLSALFFSRGDIERFKESVGVKLAPAVYGLLMAVPLILTVFSIFQRFTTSKVVVLSLLLLLSFYSGRISRKKGCIRCRMRLICPGSAVRGEKIN